MSLTLPSVILGWDRLVQVRLGKLGQPLEGELLKFRILGFGLVLLKYSNIYATYMI